MPRAEHTLLRRLAATSAAVLTGLLAGSGAAPAAPSDTGSARLQGTFVMKGKVTRADGVPGESAGQHVKRTWIFNSKCNQGACYRVVLHKHRSGGHIDKLVLQRTSPGVYSGDGHFYFPIRCAGVIDDHGGEALFTVKVRIVGTRLVQGKPFASKLSAKYENPQRINHTECQGRSLGQDGARYTGSARDLPGPPKARFRRTSTTGRTLKFEDRSTRGSGNAPLRSRSWDFGDPASGAQDTSTGSRPSHTFTAAGTYTVTLTVTDRNGLSASVSHPYTVP